MALSINNSSSSLGLQRNLGKASEDLKKANEKLSSGKRINRPSDDASGAAIAARLSAEASISAVAARNVSDGISISNIVDGALDTVGGIVSRLSELAVQAANGTVGEAGRAALDQEFQALKSELDRTANQTEFNGQQLLAGSGTTVDLQVGTGSSPADRVALTTTGVSSASLGLAGASISSAAGAAAALDLAKQAVQTVAQTRGAVGAVVSRIETAFSNLKTSETNLREAEDRISSADIAQEAANRVKAGILQQGNVGLQAKNNLNAEAVLKLIR